MSEKGLRTASAPPMLGNSRHYEREKKPGGRALLPRFVLLEHHWNGVHWDFMLESGEVLRTWAIDEPIVFGRDLPARALGDHRKIYLDYEGPIGGDRGEVRRVDGGTFRVLDWLSDRVRVELFGSQLVGEVDLRSTGVVSGLCVSWVFRAGNFERSTFQEGKVGR
jgi:DNA polymerase Ligase (LigD)